jgi:hypothetical protein
LGIPPPKGTHLSVTASPFNQKAPVPTSTSFLNTPQNYPHNLGSFQNLNSTEKIGANNSTLNMGAYTGAAASQLKNFGELSTTAVGNFKSFAGNLVNRKNQANNQNQN